MVDPAPVLPEEPATYEIRLRGEIPASVRGQYPALIVHHTATETVLYRDVTDLAELDELLEQLQAMGLVLLELRESPPSSPDAFVPDGAADGD